MYERTNLIVLKLEDVSHLWTRYNNEVKAEKNQTSYKTTLTIVILILLRNQGLISDFTPSIFLKANLLSILNIIKKQKSTLSSRY